MIYRNLGRTGLKTSILSLGTGGARRLGQDTGLGIDGQKRLVAKALEHGITHSTLPVSMAIQKPY